MAWRPGSCIIKDLMTSLTYDWILKLQPMYSYKNNLMENCERYQENEYNYWTNVMIDVGDKEICIVQKYMLR